MKRIFYIAFIICSLIFGLISNSFSMTEEEYAEVVQKYELFLDQFGKIKENIRQQAENSNREQRIEIIDHIYSYALLELERFGHRMEAFSKEKLLWMLENKYEHLVGLAQNANDCKSYCKFFTASFRIYLLILFNDLISFTVQHFDDAAPQHIENSGKFARDYRIRKEFTELLIKIKDSSSPEHQEYKEAVNSISDIRERQLLERGETELFFHKLLYDSWSLIKNKNKLDDNTKYILNKFKYIWDILTKGKREDDMNHDNLIADCIVCLKVDKSYRPKIELAKVLCLSLDLFSDPNFVGKYKKEIAETDLLYLIGVFKKYYFCLPQELPKATKKIKIRNKGWKNVANLLIPLPSNEKPQVPVTNMKEPKIVYQSEKPDFVDKQKVSEKPEKNIPNEYKKYDPEETEQLNLLEEKPIFVVQQEVSEKPEKNTPTDEAIKYDSEDEKYDPKEEDKTRTYYGGEPIIKNPKFKREQEKLKNIGTELKPKITVDPKQYLDNINEYLLNFTGKQKIKACNLTYEDAAKMFQDLKGWVQSEKCGSEMVWQFPSGRKFSFFKSHGHQKKCLWRLCALAP